MIFFKEDIHKFIDELINFVFPSIMILSIGISHIFKSSLFVL